MIRLHRENHRTERVGWLRAMVLGANDGIISTASLMLGVASSQADQRQVLIAGVAGLVAGAMSMAAGEYVSVHTQADTEKADLAREAQELKTNPEGEREELATIYEKRGLEPDLAQRVAHQLMAKDAMGAHARDELGISEITIAQPIQAAVASAVSFSVGALVPLLTIPLVSGAHLMGVVAVVSLVSLAGLGAAAARIGGAPVAAGAVRVTFWGALAMAVTSLVGRFF